MFQIAMTHCCAMLFLSLLARCATIRLIDALSAGNRQYHCTIPSHAFDVFWRRGRMWRVPQQNRDAPVRRVTPCLSDIDERRADDRSAAAQRTPRLTSL